MSTSQVSLKTGEDLFKLLAIAYSDACLFRDEHPRRLESCRGLHAALDRFFALHPQEPHVLFVQRQGEVYFRKVPITCLTPPAIKLTRLLAQRDVEGLRLSERACLSGLHTLIGALAERNPTNTQPLSEVINRRLEDLGLLSGVGCFSDRELLGLEAAGGLLSRSLPAKDHGVLALPSIEVPIERYRSVLTSLHDTMSASGGNGNPSFDPLIDLASFMTEEVLSSSADYLPLTSLRYDGEFTCNHSLNVFVLVTSALSRWVKDRELLSSAAQAALLHDFGKSHLPESLFYAAELPEAEAIEQMARHPQLAVEQLRDNSAVKPLALVAAYDHHRCPDGTGYPRRPDAGPVSVLTSLIAVADLYEALTADRPYKPGLSPLDAFRVLPRLPEARGRERAIRILFETLSPFPPGSTVELDTSELAIVVATRPGAPHGPRVRRVSVGPEGPQLDEEEIDLTPSFAAPNPPRIRRALPSSHLDQLTAEDDTELRLDADPLEELDRRLEAGTLLVTEG